MSQLKSNIRLFALFIGCFVAISSYAQEQMSPDRMPDQEKGQFFTGGSLGAQFGNSTYVDISPQIGYFVTDKLAVGIGATYQYLSYRDNTYKMQTNIFGGRAFARYYLFPKFFAHVEYEVLNLEKFDWNGYAQNSRVNVESFLVGGGYREAIGDNLFWNIVILYNTTESVYSPSSNPVIRMGIDIGL